MRFVQTGAFSDIASDTCDGDCATIVAEAGLRALKTRHKTAITMDLQPALYNRQKEPKTRSLDLYPTALARSGSTPGWTGPSAYVSDGYSKPQLVRHHAWFWARQAVVAAVLLRLKMGGDDRGLSIKHEDVLLNTLEGLVDLLKRVMPVAPSDFSLQDIR